MRDRVLTRLRVGLGDLLADRPRHQLLLIGAVIGATGALGVGAAIGLVGGRPSSPASVREVRLPRAAAGTSVPVSGGASPAGSGPAGAVVPASRSASASASARVVVHAGGAVMRPGLVTIAAEGSVPVRVADVIAAAGGLAAGADTDALNLAAPVADGQRVFVPRRGAEAPAVADVDPDVGANVVSGRSAPDAVSDPSRSIDLNRATAAELEALPGVGPATAAAIVEHRSRRGRFRSPEQLLDVPGIGPAKLAALRERVRV